MKPLYCDESVWIPVADGLRQRGWTVTTARDEGNLGLPDMVQITKSRENEWVLITFDDDFLSIVQKSDVEHAGIIYVDQAFREVGEIVKAVDAQLESTEIKDNKVYYC